MGICVETGAVGVRLNDAIMYVAAPLWRQVHMPFNYVKTRFSRTFVEADNSRRMAVRGLGAALEHLSRLPPVVMTIGQNRSCVDGEKTRFRFWKPKTTRR